VRIRFDIVCSSQINIRNIKVMVIETRARITCRCSSRAVVSAVRGAGGAAARAATWLDAVVIAAVSR
jgi:hypothetical protein